MQEGGHHIPKNIIKRRYLKGIYNLFEMYLSVVDKVLIYDNSYGNHELIAKKNSRENFTIVNIEKFHRLKMIYDTKQ